jgi:hypothetical protein
MESESTVSLPYEILCNKTSDPFDIKKENTVKINVEHLVLMLSKDWFATGLTVEQKSQIDACIIAGNSYKA